MKKATEILSEEHKNILKFIELMEIKCRKLEYGEEIDKDFFQKAILFIKDYADKFHHAKEEDILFAEFNKNSDKAHCNPVEQMLYEHQQGRGFVASMEEGLKERNKSKLVENVRNYAELLRSHIFKEDNILYPMINEVISEEAQREILKRFEDVEIKTFGLDKLKEFLNSIKGLEKNDQEY